jgi:hypothetical protein
VTVVTVLRGLYGVAMEQRGFKQKSGGRGWFIREIKLKDDRRSILT